MDEQRSEALRDAPHAALPGALREEMDGLFRDLVLAGLADGDGPLVVSVRCGDAFVLSGKDVRTFSSFSRMAGEDADAVPHAAVYMASSAAGCAAVARNERLHGMLLQGRAPAADPQAPWGSQELLDSLGGLVGAHPADGVIALPGSGAAFLLYGPDISHLRDLLAMLAQGYIPL